MILTMIVLAACLLKFFCPLRLLLLSNFDSFLLSIKHRRSDDDQYYHDDQKEHEYYDEDHAEQDQYDQTFLAIQITCSVLLINFIQQLL